MKGFFSELKGRNVFKVGIAYVVIGWVLIQVADTAFPAFSAPDWALRVFILFVALGFPLALILAWALELTPEGVRKAGGGNTPIYILALGLAAIAAYWFTSGDRPGPAPELPGAADEPAMSHVTDAEPVPSIAILPFENMSGDDGNLPFTMGIHDDLLTQVSKINSLKTISRTSVMRYRDSDKAIPEIARELGVSSVLEGGVQRIGDQVRINVQLIDAKTDEHLWSQTYDRELSAVNIFAIQSEMATSITAALKSTLTSEDQARLQGAPTESLEALEAYFTGRHLADQRKEESIEEAIRRFERAIELDPDFALAHAGLSYAWLLLPEYSASADRDLSRRSAQLAVKRALELDPKLPEGLAYLGWSRMIHDYDWHGAETLLRSALRVQSNHPDALHWLSHVLSWQGRHEEAIGIAETAVESDPLSPLMNMNLSYILMDDRQYERSAAWRERTVELQSDYPELWRNTWLTLTRAGQLADATEALMKWAAGTGRDVAKAEQLGKLIEHARSPDQAIELPAGLPDALAIGTENLGQVYAALGDAEATLAELRTALDERAGSRSVLSMGINPLYDFIRDDPRFIAMLGEINLAP